MIKVKRFKIFCSVMLLLVTLLFTGCEKKLSLQEYLDLGDKYLTESNYEQAIVAFTKAIELEPKAMKAYEGLTNAYIKTENYEKAQETIETGISVYEGLAVEEQTDEFKQIYEALLKMQEEVRAYLDVESSSDVGDEEDVTLAETKGTDTEQEPLVAEVKEKYGPILEAVVEEINSQNPTLDLRLTDDLQNFIRELENPLIWQWESGKYLGLYRGTDGDAYIYFGEMENGIRSGYGSWYWEHMAEEGPEKKVFYGNWQGDYPNGAGTNIYTYRDDFEESWGKLEGNYEDGYENGTMNDVSYYSDVDGGDHYTSKCTYSVTRGIPHILRDNARGKHIVADCTTDSEDIEVEIKIYKDGDIWGVDGAMKN